MPIQLWLNLIFKHLLLAQLAEESGVLYIDHLQVVSLILTSVELWFINGGHRARKCLRGPILTNIRRMRSFDSFYAFRLIDVFLNLLQLAKQNFVVMVNFSLPLTFLKAECNQLFLHARGAILTETTLTLATHLTTLLWMIWSSYVGIGCQLPSLRTYCRIQCAHCLLLYHFAIRGGQ